MRFREKLLIFFVAVILSVLGFYLISSSFVSLHKMAREADIKTVESYLAKYDDASRMETIITCSLQITRINFYRSHSGFLCPPGASK